MKFIAGLIVGILLVAGIAFGYFLSGTAPVAVADKTMPFERMLANGALHARIDKEMNSFDSSQLSRSASRQTNPACL